MAEFDEVDTAGEITEIQREVCVVRSEDTAGGKEETVVKIKLLEECISLQVPVEEREEEDAFQVEAETGAAHSNSDEKEETEQRSKEEARKEKRRKRREKRRERERSKESASDDNDINQEHSLQEKKAKIESEEQQDIAPEKDPTEEENSETKGHVSGEGEGGKSKDGGGERMEALNFTESPFSLKTVARDPATRENDTEEAEIEVVHSERKESAAREVKALLEANMDGEACELTEKKTEEEARARKERERRTEEVLATINFENEREVEPDLHTDSTPAHESIEEFFIAKEAKKDDIHQQLMLSSEDCNNGKTHEKEYQDSKLKELFFSEHATANEVEDTKEDGNLVEEVMVAQLRREVYIQPPVWQLTEDDGPHLNEGKEEPVALSEEEQETKLKDLFEDETPKEDDPKQEESSEPQEPAREAEVTADSQLKVEAGVDLSLLDIEKSAKPLQDGPHGDFLEGTEGFAKVSSSADEREEETEEIELCSEVQESVEEYVSLPRRKIDLCLETLSTEEELPTDVDSEEEAHQSSEKKPVKADLDSLFAFHPEQETKHEEESDGREEVLDVVVIDQKIPRVSFQQLCLESFLGKPEETEEVEAEIVQIALIEKPDETEEKIDEQHEQQPVVVGEEVKEEEINEERTAATVECAWDMSFFDEQEKNEKSEKDKAAKKEKSEEEEAEAEIGNETLEAETKKAETLSTETQVEKFTESKTTYTTSIVMKPVSPTMKKPAPTFDTAGIPQTATGDVVSRETVTTTLETIVLSQATPQDSTTGKPQEFRSLKKKIEDTFEPLPEKESEGTAPLAQVEGSGLEAELPESAKEGIKPRSEKDPLIEKVPNEEEPNKADEAKAQGKPKELEVGTKEPEPHDDEDLIPEERKKTKGKGTPKHRPKCCVLQ